MLKRVSHIVLFIGMLTVLGTSPTKSQTTDKTLARLSVYKGDTIAWIELKPVYIYKPLKFKSKKKENSYTDLYVTEKKKCL